MTDQNVADAHCKSNQELRVEHFKHLCEQTRHFNDKFTEAFTTFVQTFSLIVAGCVYLATIKKNDILFKLEPKSLEYLSDALVYLLLIGTLIRMGGNMTAWWSYRVSQNRVYNEVPLPVRLKSCWMELSMAKVILLAAVAFSIWNPFSLFPPN